MMHMDAQWLNAQFKLNSQKSKAELAKALGLEPPAVSKILNGTRQIKAQEYAVMRRFFGLPVDGEKAARPYAAPANHTQNHDISLQDQEHFPATDWGVPTEPNQAAQTTGNTQIFKIRENLMEPDFMYGEHVLVDLGDTVPSPPGAFIVSDGFGHLIRWCEIIQGSKPPEIRLSARESNFTAQALQLNEIHIIGRIIAKLQWV